jgi:hypothetical protein
MPTIPETWFERNFGVVPASFRSGPTLGRTDIPATTKISPAKPYDIPEPGLVTNYQPDIIEGWRAANEAMARARMQQESSAVSKMARDRTTQAQVRSQLRAALEAARKNRKVTTDWTAMNQPADAAMGNPMITPSNVKDDLGRNLTDKDKFWTGQFETTTAPIIGQPRNRYEAMLDSRVIGTQVTRTPIMVTPRYKDAAGEALWYAQQKRLNQTQIQAWQAYFVARQLIKPGEFVYGAWDAATQKAMYQQMGEANAMGQTVDGLRGAYESQWRNGAGGGYGPAGGGGAAVPRVTTQRIFSITSLAKGGQILKAYLQQELGRDPSKAEIAAYVRLLNGQERKSPTVVTTNYSADGTSSTSTTKEANVDPGDTADDFLAQSMKKEKGARDTMEYMSILAGM